MRTPDAPLATDMDAPGLERRLRIRALRCSWIKDAVQAVAFTAAGIRAIYTFWYREKYLPQVSETDVTVGIVVESLGERDGVVTVRARTVLENPGKVPGQRPGPTPPRPLRRPPIGGVLPFGAFIDLEDESLFFVRRAEYSVLNVEAQLAWLPAAYPLRKECYTLVRDEEGVVSVRVPDAAMRRRLSTVSPTTGIAFR